MSYDARLFEKPAKEVGGKSALPSEIDHFLCLEKIAVMVSPPQQIVVESHEIKKGKDDEWQQAEKDACP